MQNIAQFKVPLFVRPVDLGDELILVDQNDKTVEIVLGLIKLGHQDVGKFKKEALEKLQKSSGFMFIDQAWAEQVYVALKEGKINNKIPDGVNEIVVLGSFIQNRSGNGGKGVCVFRRYDNGPWTKVICTQEQALQRLKVFYTLAFV